MKKHKNCTPHTFINTSPSYTFLETMIPRKQLGKTCDRMVAGEFCMCRVGNSVIGNCSSNKKKPVAQGRDGKSTACATKMTCDRKCHRERGRKSNQATRSQRTRETGKQGQTHLQAPRFLEARAASAFSGGQ